MPLLSKASPVPGGLGGDYSELHQIELTDREEPSNSSSSSYDNDGVDGQEMTTISTTIVFGGESDYHDDERDAGGDMSSSSSSSSSTDEQHVRKHRPSQSIGNHHRFIPDISALALSSHTTRRRITLVQVFGLLLGTFPVVFFAFEMADDWCTACMSGVTLTFYLAAAAACGGAGAILYGSDSTYWFAQLMGGAASALGAQMTIYMLLQSVHSSVVLFFLFVGVLGAMPGLLLYFLVKIMTDELNMDHGQNDRYDEISPLTLPLANEDHSTEQ